MQELYDEVSSDVQQLARLRAKLALGFGAILLLALVGAGIPPLLASEPINRGMADVSLAYRNYSINQMQMSLCETAAIFDSNAQTRLRAAAKISASAAQAMPGTSVQSEAKAGEELANLVLDPGQLRGLFAGASASVDRPETTRRPGENLAAAGQSFSEATLDQPAMADASAAQPLAQQHSSK
jgi:hypothetical protein